MCYWYQATFYTIFKWLWAIVLFSFIYWPHLSLHFRWELPLECAYRRLMVSSIRRQHDKVTVLLSNIQRFIKPSASTGAQSITLDGPYSYWLLINISKTAWSGTLVCVIGEDPDVLTFEMPVDELERTLRQRRCVKGFPFFLFPQRKLHNGSLFCFCSFYPPHFDCYFPFPPENGRVVDKQTQKKERLITLRFGETNKSEIIIIKLRSRSWPCFVCLNKSFLSL